MARWVFYNGGTESWKWCDEPDVLERGKMYEVIATKIGDYQTNLRLKGINGEFNSTWFDPANAYLALGAKPVKGNPMTDFYYWKEGGWHPMKVSQNVTKVSQIGAGVYQAVTDKEIYIVQAVR